MTTERFTLDTNILVYSLDASAGFRFAVAADIVDRAALRDCHLPLQALSEFFSVATRKGKLPAAQAIRAADNWLGLFPTLAGTPGALRAAMRTAAGGVASYWDALLVATAAEAGCTAILTEDMADGAVLLGVRVINPFAGGGLSAAADALLR